MQGSNGFTKSMSGVLELSDGNGTDIQDGTVTCTNVIANDIKTNTLEATSIITSNDIQTTTLTALTSITTNILNVTTIVVSSISLATAYITTLYARNIRSDTPSTAVGLFDTQTSAINMGTPSSSFIQQGNASIGLSGAGGVNGTNGLQAQTGVNIADLIFRDSLFWSSFSRIRSSTGTITFDAAYFSFSNFAAYIFDIATTSSGIFLKFHSGTTYTTYDSQISGTGGTGVIGGGTLTLNASTLNLTAPTVTTITTPTLNIQNTTPALGGNTVEIGTGGGYAYVDFHSNSSFTTDYDSRILATNGTATDGQGTLAFFCKILSIRCPLELNYYPTITSNQLGYKINGTSTGLNSVAGTYNNFSTLTLPYQGVWLLIGNTQFISPSANMQISISSTSGGFDSNCGSIVGAVAYGTTNISRTINTSTTSLTWYLIGTSATNSTIQNVVLSATRIA